MRVRLICTAFVIALTGTLALAQDAQPTMRLSSGNLPPVNTEEHDGYLNRLVIALFERIGYDVEFVDLPSRRAIENMNNGLTDGDVARLPLSAASTAHSRMLGPALMEVDFVGLYLDPNIAVEEFEDFASYSVGYIRGWQLAERLFADHPNATQVGNPENLMRMLKEGRVDVVFLTRAPGQYFAEQLHVEDLKFTTYFLRKGIHLHLNNRHAVLLPDLAEHLAQMHLDGTYAKIMSGYLTQ